MSVDLFSGFRRIAIVLAVIWSAGCIAFALSSSPSIAPALVVYQFGATPVLSSNQECTEADAREYFSRDLAGGWVYGAICFKAMAASNEKMLVPYAQANEPGRVWLADKYSREVVDYTKSVASSFEPSAEQLKELKALMLSDRFSIWRKALSIALLGCIVIFVVSVGIGWIARGFVSRPGV